MDHLEGLPWQTKNHKKVIVISSKSAATVIIIYHNYNNIMQAFKPDFKIYNTNNAGHNKPESFRLEETESTSLDVKELK
jgi:hypothetical protein